MNHDALFKRLLKNRSILCAFFHQFLPEAARFVDFERLDYADKERVTIDGKRRTGDLLIKTRFRGKNAGFLIHLEHQAQPDRDLARRMLEYFILDWRDFNLPVYPIAVLTHSGRSPCRTAPLLVTFPNKRVLEFDFDIVDLSRLDARAFVKLENAAALALASRMKFEAKDRIGLTRDFFLSLSIIPLDRAERELVAGFFSAYQRLNAQEALQLQGELAIVEPYEVRERVMQLTNPFIELISFCLETVLRRGNKARWADRK